LRGPITLRSAPGSTPSCALRHCDVVGVRCVIEQDLAKRKTGPVRNLTYPMRSRCVGEIRRITDGLSSFGDVTLGPVRKCVALPNLIALLPAQRRDAGSG